MAFWFSNSSRYTPVQAPLTGMSAVLCRNSGATAAGLQDASGDCDHDIGHNEMANTAKVVSALSASVFKCIYFLNLEFTLFLKLPKMILFLDFDHRFSIFW